MKSYTTAILGAALAVVSQSILTQTTHAQASTNLYKVAIRADGVTTNDLGRLAGAFADHREIIRKCASENGITNFNSLTLVYDRDADALEVVNRTTGTLLCSPFTFNGGVTLPNSKNTVRERLAFVYLDESQEAAGTIRAELRYRYNSNGNVVGFSLTAKLQFALTPGEQRGKIFSAFLMTGPRFVPGH